MANNDIENRINDLEAKMALQERSINELMRAIDFLRRQNYKDHNRLESKLHRLDMKYYRLDEKIDSVYRYSDLTFLAVAIGVWIMILMMVAPKIVPLLK